MSSLVNILRRVSLPVVTTPELKTSSAFPLQGFHKQNSEREHRPSVRRVNCHTEQNPLFVEQEKTKLVTVRCCLESEVLESLRDPCQSPGSSSDEVNVPAAAL